MYKAFVMNNRQVLVNNYNEVYQQLNAQQQLAVNTLEGPVMVIAGPGTGKTQILAARIGKILLDTDALPENIICLTYTDAGAIAMRRRLQKFIGADAYKVTIATFHAFCNEVIQDNLHLFEKSSLDAISELESIELFKSLIDAFPKGHILKRYRGDVYFEINNLRQLFSAMKKEGWTPEYLNSKIDEYIAGLEFRDEFIYKRKYKEFNAGDLKKDKIAEETEKMEKLRAAVNEFNNYQHMMRQRNRYDFDDMINWVIKVFETHDAVLKDYQEKYQYILVDEFQDTSGTQNKLVQLLISYWEQPNVFVVGDDDQSIYRFQGANVENMEVFANSYKEHITTVILTNNYRSTQPILDVSKTLIDNNTSRLINLMPGLSKELVASNTGINNIITPPQIIEYNSVKEEMAGITYTVATLINDGVAPGSIAVIYKENKYGEDLSAFLRLKGLPVYSKRSINLLHNAFVLKLVQILRYINAELDTPYGGDEMLFEILHYDFWNIPPIEIARVTVEVNSRNYSGVKTSIRNLLAEKAAAPAKDLFDTGLHTGLRKISVVLEQLIADAVNITLQQLFENVIQKAGVLSYIMQHPEKMVLMQLLTAFFNFIKDETSRNPVLSLRGLINTIDLMEKEGISLPMQQVAGSDKGINLLTAHGSKGLEFKYVFFAGVNASSWEKKKKPGGGFKLPDTVFDSAASSQQTDVEELRRLFYVALTRAETDLCISYARYKNDGKEMEPSRFIAEIQEKYTDLQAEKVAFTDTVMFEFQTLQFTEQKPEIGVAEEDFISNLLDKFVMSVTALNSYLKCPLHFYFQHLIRIPSGKNEALEFGSAIHFALERLFKKMQESGTETFPAQENMMDDFNWYMRKHRENFTAEAFERRMEYGDKVLRDYYNTYIHQWNKTVSVERNIRGVTVNGVPVKGKLDKLEFNGNDVNVVDYKTGDIDKARPKLKGPDDKTPLGGDYWRQAVFYKLLIDNYAQKNWRVLSTEFDFIEPDKKNEYRKEKIVIAPQDTLQVTQQLTDTWHKIQAREFYTGCGKADCHWCNFVKTNNLAVALHEANEEEQEE